MNKKYGLSKHDFYTIINVFRNYSMIIEEAILFGSRARGDYKPISDIDIAIKFRKEDVKIYEIQLYSKY